MFHIRTPPLNVCSRDGLQRSLFENLAFGHFFAERMKDAGPLTGKRALEIGCGTGQASVWFALQGAAVTGIDKRRKATERARELAESHGVADRTRFEVGKIEQLPYEDDSFDLVFSQSVLQYTDRAAVIAECVRVLRPGGRLVMIENMPGNPGIRLVRLLRRATAWSETDRAYLNSIRGYLTATEARGLASRLENGKFETRFITQIVTFFWFRTHALPRVRPIVALDRALERLDRHLASNVPGSERLAWIGSVTGTKPREGSVRA